MIYRCNDCGAYFDEPREVEEYHSEVHASEWFTECPECGSSEFEECNRCTIKYEYKLDGKIRKVSDGTVYDHYSEAEEALCEILSDLEDKGAEIFGGEVKDYDG